MFRSSLLRKRRATHFALTLIVSACGIDEARTVDFTRAAVYRGSIHSLGVGDSDSIALSDESRVEFQVVVNETFLPVPNSSCDIPFCSSFEDFNNSQLWDDEYAYNLSLRIRNATATPTTTELHGTLDCVYASGNPLPAPWQSRGVEHQDSVQWVDAGEEIEVRLACLNFGPGSVFDGAWTTGATVDVDLFDDVSEASFATPVEGDFGD